MKLMPQIQAKSPRSTLLSGFFVVCLWVFVTPAWSLSPQNQTVQAAQTAIDRDWVLLPIRYAQNGSGQGIRAQNRQGEKRKNIRSRSDVVNEVKRRYNAEVLKIALNQSRSSYNVRILMPSGKVRNIQVSAQK